MNPYNMSEPELPNQTEEESNQSKQINKKSKLAKLSKKISQCIKETPLLTKMVTIIIITFFLFFGTLRYYGFYFVNFPNDLLYEFHFQRLIFGSFIVTRWWNLALILIFWVPKVIQFEKSIGTIRYAFLFVINTLGIQLLYTLSSFLFYNFMDYQMSLLPGRKQSYKQSVGLIPYVLMELTIDFLANKKTTTNIAWFKCKVNSIVPLLLLFFFSLCFNSYMFIQLSLGIVYGFIYYHLFRNNFYLEDDKVLKLEQGHLSCFTRRNGFISLKNAQDYNLELIEEHNKSLMINRSNEA